MGVPGTARAARPGEMLVSQTGEGRLRQLLSEGGLPGWHGGHGCVMLQGEHVHIQAGSVVRPSVPRHEGLQQRQRYLRCLARTGWLELALILAYSALSLKPEIHRIFSEHLGLRTAVGLGQVIGSRPDQTLPASPVGVWSLIGFLPRERAAVERRQPVLRGRRRGGRFAGGGAGGGGPPAGGGGHGARHCGPPCRRHRRRHRGACLSFPCKFFLPTPQLSVCDAFKLLPTGYVRYHNEEVLQRTSILPGGRATG